MKQKLENIPPVVPPVLDPEEAELSARNELIAEENFSATDFAEPDLGESELEHLPEADENNSARRTKFRKSLTFLTIFGAFFGILVIFLGWSFGFGPFAAPKNVTIDRNQKAKGVEPGAPDGEEKLKTALSLIADNNGNQPNSPVVSNPPTEPKDLTLSSEAKKKEFPDDHANDQGGGNMIVLPDENVKNQPNPPAKSARQIPPSQINSPGPVNLSSAPANQPDQDPVSSSKNQTKGSQNPDGKIDGEISARSVFFGRTAAPTSSPRTPSMAEISPRKNETQYRPVSIGNNQTLNIPSFGTLLPVRLLGAVFTLPGAGNLVRLELTRAIRQNNFSYPAGTVLVGHLRGSDYNRAFISIFGAIDPKSGRLLEFSGEVNGTDGASGIVGTRKTVKSWGTRFLQALREVSGQAVDVWSAGRGRSGTIVLGGSGGPGGEISSVIRANDQKDSFVMVKAGTEGYVLVTGLPKSELPRSGTADESQIEKGQLPGLNLSEAELAEILVTDDADKVRAALLKMSPKARQLALQAMTGEKN